MARGCWSAGRRCTELRAGSWRRDVPCTQSTHEGAHRFMVESSLNGTLPLADIRVLDLTLARAGPTCIRHLADWGADVIRIEPAGTQTEDAIGMRHGFDFQNLHRNK